MLAFVIFFAFLWGIEAFARDYVKPRRVKFAAVFMYVGGISANLIGIAYNHNVISYGPSGVVYAFIGIVISLSLINILLPNWERWKDEITRIRAGDMLRLIYWFLYFSSFGYFFIPGASYPRDQV